MHIGTGFDESLQIFHEAGTSCAPGSCLHPFAATLGVMSETHDPTRATPARRP
jgi:hypothetical protein